jgi:SAM-dependent MidA family methyltransferase
VTQEQPGPAIPGYRIEPMPDPESVGEDAELVEAIRDEIRQRGPITFARFMARALYEPGHGYYRRPTPGPGRQNADFITAPEAHPIFGAAVGRLVAQAWGALGRPEPFTIREPGAGTGAMALGLLAGLRDDASPLFDHLRYRPIEVEPARVATFRERLTAEGFAAQLVEAPEADEAEAEVDAAEAEADAAEAEVEAETAVGRAADADETEAAAAETEAGAVIANEVLDALPVHRVIGRAGAIRELLVTTDVTGRFTTIEAEPTTPALAARLDAEGITLADGQITEICLEIDDWLTSATRHLRRGIVILIDYADEPAALHGPTRPTGTLRAFARHAVGSDPFRHIGRQDLTATVDLAAVRTAAANAGLQPIGETTAGELLAAAGNDLPGRYLARPGATLQDALTLRSALARLLDPRGLGGFRVLAFGRGLPPEPDLPALRRLAKPSSGRA